MTITALYIDESKVCLSINGKEFRHPVERVKSAPYKDRDFDAESKQLTMYNCRDYFDNLLEFEKAYQSPQRQLKLF